MATVEEEDEDNFVGSLRQFISSIDPVLKQYGPVATAEDVQGILTRLETTDENFHRYDFVRQLRQRIDSALGVLVDEELEKRAFEGDRQALIPVITEEILHSPQYGMLYNSLKGGVKMAVNSILAEITDNPHTYGSDFIDWKPRYQRLQMDCVDEDESLMSSLEQEDLMFMSQEKFVKIADALGASNPINFRQEALTQLSRMPGLSDIVGSSCWSATRKGIMDALIDEDEELADRSSRLLAKMFGMSLSSSSAAEVTREVYTCLAEHLSQFFADGSPYMMDIERGVHLGDRHVHMILQRFRLMNDFQHEVSSFWIRYPARVAEDIIESTISLLAVSNLDPQMMTALHFLAIVDPKASWFKKWMHGSFSRTEVVKQLKKHSNLLVEAVRHCLDFATTCKSLITLQARDTKSPTYRPGQGLGQLSYNGQELDFLYVYHSLNLLGRLLLFADGRALFPFDLWERDESVSVTHLLVAFIQIMCAPPGGLADKQSLQDPFHPGALIATLLKNIASGTEETQNCLCKDAITTALLSPVQLWLDGFHGLDESTDHTEETFLLIADVLATLAVSQIGQQHLLYGEAMERWQRSRFAPAQIIADFTKKALNGKLVSPIQPSQQVVVSFVFVCRQIYNTCEGLLVLNSYCLHQHLANAWKQHEREIASPESREENSPEVDSDSAGTDQADIDQEGVDQSENDQSGQEDGSSGRGEVITPASQSDQDLMLWGSSLIDNLLNYATTPKGMLLLLQTGVFEQCVSYMYIKYAKNMQVSKCEKFGYGVMVTQVAATAPGISALEKTGLLRIIVQDIWDILEESKDDYEIITPSIRALETTERQMHKLLISLLNVLSSFGAIYEVLKGQALRVVTPTFENDEDDEDDQPWYWGKSLFQTPSSVLDLLDRLVIIDSDLKIHSLYDFERCHHLGLRILSALCSCLDTFLLLETQYGILGNLLQLQKDSKYDNDIGFIIDRCSVERNQVLVRCHVIGGPNERIIPPRTLVEDEDGPYPWPMFCEFPPPDVYIPTDHPQKFTAFAEDNQLLNFLEGPEPLPAERAKWLNDCREKFSSTLISNHLMVRGKVVSLMLNQVSKVLCQDPEEAIFHLINFSVGESELRGVELNAVETQGIQMVVRYGLQLRLLSSKQESVSSLSHLLKQCKYMFQRQQKPVISSLRTLDNEYPGHDWYASTIFLIMHGNPDKAWEFLFRFSSLVSSGYVWMPRLHLSVHLPSTITASGIPPVYSTTCHIIEMLLQAEVPLVFSAFRMSGYTPSQICQQWLRQCFWNFLDWDDITLYIAICLIMGIDYQVYFCIAILRHLQRDILYHTHKHNLILFLKEEAIKGFKAGEHVEYMQFLEKKYRSTILQDIQNITKA